MRNCFGDDNLQLIDLSEEDDYLIAFHSFEDVQLSDNGEQRRRSLLRKSLGWDSAFFTSDSLLSPEELVMVNKGLKKLNPATRKDAKSSTESAGYKHSSRKMNICSQNKEKVTSLPKIFSSRRTNNAAVGRSDNDVKIENKTRKAQDSKRSKSGGLLKLTSFASPTDQKIVPCLYESSYGAKGSTKIVGCNSFKKMNICAQNKKQDKVTRLPNNNAAVERSDNGVKLKIENKTKKVQGSKMSPSGGLPKLTCFTSPTNQKTINHLHESSSSKNLSKSIKGKVNPKRMELVNSPTSVFHFPLSPSSTSPASFVDGESLFSSTISHQNYEELKFISQNATIGSGGPKRKIKSSGPCTPSPKIRYFDEVVDLISQDQCTFLPCVTTGNCLIGGKDFSRKPDGRKVGSSCSKSKADRQIQKEILENRMMSSDQQRQKGDSRSLQADEDNGLSGELECIDLQRNVVEGKGQQLSFGDDNLQLMDCFEEDACLTPFPKHDSLEDLRLSATFDNVHKEVQSEQRRQSFLCKSLAWDSAFFTSKGLLNAEELFMINTGFKKSNLTTPKDSKRSKVATKLGGSHSNSLSCKKLKNAAAVKGLDNAKLSTAQDSKRSQSGVVSKPTFFTSPITKRTFHHPHESSSKNLSEYVKRKVNPKNMKLVNSPSSVLHFPLSPSSPSPASSIDGESLFSTPVTCQNIIPVLAFESQDSEGRKLISQNAVKSSGLRMPSPRIGFFDMDPGSMQDFLQFNESQFRSSNLFPWGNCLKVGKFPITFIGDNWVNLSGPTRDRIIGLDQEYYLHSRTPLAGKMLPCDALSCMS